MSTAEKSLPVITPMELRKPRKTVKRRGYWADFKTLTHPKMLLVIVAIASVGHFIAPGSFDWRVYFWTTIGLVFMVLINYRVNEMHDKTSAPSTSKDDHIVWIILFSVVVFTSMMIVSVLQGYWVLLLVLVGIAISVVYNLDLHPLLHSKPVYGLIWGGLPLLFSQMTQAGNPLPTLSGLIFTAWASVLAVLTLWLWGPMTCGRMEVCARAEGQPTERLCHSPVLRCVDRLHMPKEVHNHMKVLITLNIWAITALSVGMAFLLV